MSKDPLSFIVCDYKCHLLYHVLHRWKIIIGSVPENLASVNITQWVVQLRYSVFFRFSVLPSDIVYIVTLIIWLLALFLCILS